MRISKKSRLKSELIPSRFDGAGTDAASVRDLQRAREGLVGAVVQVCLLIGLAVALVLFGRAVARLFARHGGRLDRWIQPVVLASIVAAAVVSGCLAWHKLMKLGKLRREIQELTARVRALRTRMRRRA